MLWGFLFKYGFIRVSDTVRFGPSVLRASLFFLVAAVQIADNSSFGKTLQEISPGETASTRSSSLESQDGVHGFLWDFGL